MYLLTFASFFIGLLGGGSCLLTACLTYAKNGSSWDVLYWWGTGLITLVVTAWVTPDVIHVVAQLVIAAGACSG